VHCGFCLQACPTYLALEDENDSPRGRIVLMKSMADGGLSMDDTDAQLHLDRCLGCRACETACPSGVPYGQLLETTRERIAARRALPAIARLILFVFSSAPLLAISMWKARVFRATRIPALLSRLPGRLGFAMAMLASTSRRRAETARSYAPRGDGSRGKVATLAGCVMEGLLAPANCARSARSGERMRSHVSGQRCCALHAHAGDAATSATRAGERRGVRGERRGFHRGELRRLWCTMKEYAHLLAGDPAWRSRAETFSAKVRDVSELLAAAGPVTGGRLPVRVAYDAPCHLLHGQRLSAPPLAVLAAIAGLEQVPLPDSEQCCGVRHLQSRRTQISDLSGDRSSRISPHPARDVATGNPGRLMQIGAGLRRAGSSTQTRHPVELLDASYAQQRAGNTLI
jgi:glycolate oxidase iron-sulfur subunit